MDAKITKKRLSEDLQYDWIKIIFFVVAIIIVWELVFSVTSVKLTAGQNFKVYYYSSINSSSQLDMYDLVGKDSVTSYDVVEVNVEALQSGYEGTVLQARTSIGEGDLMIIDNVLTKSSTVEKETDERCSASNFKLFVDGYQVYDYDKLIEDANKYLDGVKTNGDIDNAKVEKLFRQRMAKDNRFRKEEQIKLGVRQEIERITKLGAEVKAFSWLLANAPSDLFVEYTKYEYGYFNSLSKEDYLALNGGVSGLSCQGGGSSTSGDNFYEEAYKRETPKKYAINALALTGGEKDIANLFHVYSTDTNKTAKDVCITVFNFKSMQPHLQFETISVINEIIRSYSNLYSGYNP